MLEPNALALQAPEDRAPPMRRSAGPGRCSAVASMALPRLAPPIWTDADRCTESAGESLWSKWPGSALRRGRLAGLVWAGLLLELLLVLSFVPAPLVPLTADSGMDELLPWLWLLGQPIHDQMRLLKPWIGMTPLAIGLQVGCFLALFGSYVLALRALRRRSDLSAGRVVLLFAVMFELTGLCSRRLFSKDLFSYVLNGRIAAVYGGNPYVDVPIRFPQDPYLPLVDWREVPNFYGPLWTLISEVCAWLGGEQLGPTLLLFRLVPAAAVIATSFLIWRLLRRSDPSRAALGVALWAWNPLVILESAGSGHNDAVLALLLVLAAAGLVWRRPVVGLAALAGGVLVKYSAAALAPLYLVALLRRARGPAERRRVALGVAAAGVLAALSFAPFWRGDGALAVGALVSSPARYLNSPAELVFARIRLWLGDDSLQVVERLEFRPWWAAASSGTDLFLERAEIPIARIEEDQVVLALNRSDGRWQRVYDPTSRLTGYVSLSALRSTTRPTELAEDQELAAYERGPAGTNVARQVNLVIRAAGWLVVGLAMLALMRSAHTPDQLLSGWLTLLVLVYWLVATWFFPWYLLWGLAIAALRPRGALAWAMVVWSAGVLLYYGLAPLERDRTLDWLYHWRAVPMFLPPLVVLGWHLVARRVRGSAPLVQPIEIEGRPA